MNGSNLREVRLRWLAPALVLFSLLVNYSIANASLLRLDSFAPVVVLPERVANYGKDPFGLAFPPANPQLVNIVLQEREEEEGEAEPSGTTTSEAGQNTPTPLIEIPTLPALLPTLPPLLPTLPPLLPALTPLVPTQVQPIVETLVPPVIPTVLAPIVTQLPVCVPLPPLINCP